MLFVGQCAIDSEIYRTERPENWHSEASDKRVYVQLEAGFLVLIHWRISIFGMKIELFLFINGLHGWNNKLITIRESTGTWVDGCLIEFILLVIGTIFSF